MPTIFKRPPRAPALPSRIDLPAGPSSAGQAGTYAPADATVTVSIEGDTAGVFQVVDIQLFDLVHDPDTPPGSPPVLEFTGSVRGPGPIAVAENEAVLTTVLFTAPAFPSEDAFTATAVMVGDTWPEPFEIPVAVADLHVTVQVLTPTVDITQGGTATLGLRVTSHAGPDTTVDVFSVSAPQGVGLSETTVLVPRGATVDATAILTAQPDAPAGANELQGVEFTAFDGAQRGDIDHQVVVDVIGVDRTVQWEETTDLAISVDAGQDAWNAGRLKDVLLRSDAIFVASSTGGVWGIDFNDPEAGAGCVTDDFDNPNFTCLAFGPDSPLQIYAGCSSLKLGSRPGTGLAVGGFQTWTPVPIVDAGGQPILTDDIMRIEVLAQHRVLLLATMGGVFMATIPAGGGRLAFARAPSVPVAAFSGMCAGPSESVAVSRLGPPGDVWLGTWSGGGLSFAQAQILSDDRHPDNDVDVTKVTRTSLASCGSDPSRMYAVLAGPDSRIYRILRSEDGGATWRPMPNTATRVAQQRVGPLAPDSAELDMAGSTGWYTNCIGVGFHDSDEVGIGWANGPWLTSDASADPSHWVLAYETANSPHVHGDIQFIRFDPGDASGDTIYVASDGGLTVTRDRAGATGYASRLSRHVRNLQFYGGLPPGEKGAFGRLGCGVAASPTEPGLIAGPTQDNGSVFCDLEGSAAPAWQRLEGGDGLPMRFLANGLLLFVSVRGSNHARLAEWDGSTFTNITDVPVTSPSADALSVFGDVQPVTQPRFRAPDSGKTLYAVAATQNAADELRTIYGLFSDGTVAGAEWQLIGLLPQDPGATVTITSLASLTGNQVFAGTAEGRIFSLAPFQDPFELTVRPADKGPVHDITVVREDDTLAFALYNGPETRAVLQSNFFEWDPLGANDNVARGLSLPGDENFIAMGVDRAASPPTLYVCTDSQVFLSRDEGDTWLLATARLPARAHCTSFAFGAPRPSGRYVYLGTYGRSVWQARL